MPLTRVKYSGIAANTFVGGGGVVITANTTTSQIIISTTVVSDEVDSFLLAGM
jgi:hypothetical protein